VARQEAFDVAIAGAGVAGLALACALADGLAPQGRILVADAASLDGAALNARDPRAFALAAGSRRLLEAIGAWPALAPLAQPVTAVDISDSSLDAAIRPVLLSYDNRLGEAEPATFIVEARHLHAALLDAAKARPRIVLSAANAVTGFAAGEHAIVLERAQGPALPVQLLVAADGRSSKLRTLAGIEVVGFGYSQIGIVTAVAHERSHGGRAVQHFLPGGPFAILPLVGKRSLVTWTEDAARGRAILALADEPFLAEIERRFGHRLGRLALAGARGSFPLEMHLARSLIAPRFALLGDAAHGVHPIAGQGLNLGLRDVAALAEVVADAARLGLDVGSRTPLERYERWRRLDTAMSAASYDALNRLFSNDVTLVRTARDFGLGLLERMPELKRLLVNEAAGLSGEVPKLLRGERL
jgi:2-octaprenyl-6-methoxyphenol hydroxylase